MVQYCSVKDVKDFVGPDNIPDFLTDVMIQGWIIQASAFIDKSTDTDWGICDVDEWGPPGSTPDSCEMIRECCYLIVSAKLVKRGGIDRLYNTGAAASGNIKKYSLGALSVERDVTSSPTSTSESTVNLYNIIIEEADKILALFGASIDNSTVWGSGIIVDATNTMENIDHYLTLSEWLLEDC